MVGIQIRRDGYLVAVAGLSMRWKSLAILGDDQVPYAIR